MADNANISAEAAEAQKLNDLTGMGIEPEEIVTDSPEVKPEVKPEPKPEVKAEEVDTEDDEEGEIEEKTEDKGIRPQRAKSEKPIKAAFKQIGDLRNNVDKILAKLDSLTPVKQEAVEAVDDALKSLADRRGLDADGLAEIAEVLQKRILDNLEKNGALKKDLPPEIQDKLKMLDELQAKNAKEAEVAHFETEWTALLPELQKQYPNAKAGELLEAKKIMDELAHSKDFHKYELDYVLFKNRSKFDTLLKVAKGTKSGETAGSKQITEFDPEEDIDLDPENMTPDKMKAYEKRKYSGQSEKVEIIG